MRKTLILFSSFLALLLVSSCSPRDFLTRRLATDLIVGSDAFKTPQQVLVRTGIISSKDYLAPEYPVLQRRGWISAATVSCPAQVSPPPCWDVVLTPSGVETIRLLVAPSELDKPAFSVPAAGRELVAITGISKQGNVADVEFTWRWIPLNEVGAAFYSSDRHYRSTAGFREYDDGWRLAQSSPRPAQSLDDALKSAEPAP